MATQQYTAEQMIKALTEAKGLVSVAARMLGCSRQTVYNHINKQVTVKQAMEDARETMTDFAEGKLFEQINTGNITAIIFYLKTQGKSRGYVERQELTGKDGESITEGLIINVGDKRKPPD